MSLYAWKGLDAGGKTIGGTRDADGAKALRQSLRRDGVFMTELAEVLGGSPKSKSTSASAISGGPSRSLFRRDVNVQQLLERVRPQEIAVFTRQLGTLLHEAFEECPAVPVLQRIGQS